MNDLTSCKTTSPCGSERVVTFYYEPGLDEFCIRISDAARGGVLAVVVITSEMKLKLDATCSVTRKARGKCPTNSKEHLARIQELYISAARAIELLANERLPLGSEAREALNVALASLERCDYAVATWRRSRQPIGGAN